MARSVLVRNTNSPWEVFQTCETPQPPGWKVGEYFFRAFCIGVEPRHYWRGWIPSRCTIAPCSARATSFFLSVGSMRRWEANGLQKPRVSFDTSATNPLNCQNGYSVWY
jgi:hypothetical protein